MTKNIIKMHTKLVYVVISNYKDIYLEQAWVSAYSARYHNPDSYIIFVTDEETKKDILQTGRKAVLSVINEIIAVPFPYDITNMQRSRWIKTNLRHLIKGDLLFIDTDTIITGNLAEIDQWTFNLGMVPEFHCPFKDSFYEKGVLKMFKHIYGIKHLKDDTEYYNSGIYFAKDNKETHQFCTEWHKNWEISLRHGITTDQQSLGKTCYDNPHFIHPIDGIYNCMIRVSIQYLHNAKIIHFFNAKWGSETLSPFFRKETFQIIKNNQCITDEIKYCILHCKEEFESPSFPINKEDAEIWISPTFMFLRWLKSHCNFFFRLIQLSSRILLYIINKLSRKITL